MAAWKWVGAVSGGESDRGARRGWGKHLLPRARVHRRCRRGMAIRAASPPGRWAISGSRRTARIASAGSGPTCTSMNSSYRETTDSGFPSPTSITVGPDGNLWFVEDQARKISRITSNGTITQFPVPSAINDPIDITSGPDGKLWFTELVPQPRHLQRPASWGTSRSTAPSTRSAIDAPAYSIARGPDNALWFTTLRPRPYDDQRAVSRLSDRRSSYTDTTSPPARTARCGSPTSDLRSSSRRASRRASGRADRRRRSHHRPHDDRWRAHLVLQPGSQHSAGRRSRAVRKTTCGSPPRPAASGASTSPARWTRSRSTTPTTDPSSVSPPAPTAGSGTRCR